MPVSSWTVGIHAARAVACATRSGLALPWPVPSSVPDPLDLKWLTTTMKSSPPPTGVNAWAIGSRALPKAWPSALSVPRARASPSRVTAAVR